MRLNHDKARLLLDNFRTNAEADFLSYKKTAEELSNELKKYKGENLLVIKNHTEIDGIKVPLIMFGEYFDMDPSSPYIGDLRFYFKKPFLYAEIKIRNSKVRSSSVRFRWHKVGDYPSKFFFHVDNNKTAINAKRDTAFIYKNEIIFDACFKERDDSCKYGLSSNQTAWDLISVIFGKRMQKNVDYGNLYEFFNLRYSTDCSYR